MSDEIEEEDRRQGDRREDERREFRRETGRRDEVVSERRGRPGRVRRLAVVLVVLLVGFLGWRSIVVGPARVAAAEATQALIVAQDIFSEVHLPGIAAPGFGAPSDGDPGLADLSSLLGAPQRDELSRIDTRLAPALEAAPRVAGVPEVLAPIRLLLGREREARLAWEALLRTGDPRQRGRARVGLAVVAIRAGLRATEEQDAMFAYDVAAAQLEQVDDGHPDAEAAAADLALIEALRRRWTDPAGPPTIETAQEPENP